MTIRLNSEHVQLLSSSPPSCSEEPQHRDDAGPGSPTSVRSLSKVLRTADAPEFALSVDDRLSAPIFPRPVTPPPLPPSAIGAQSNTAYRRSSPRKVSHRVRFADTLVSDVRCRPYTPVEDVSALFYSSEETTAFRMEYRLERKLLAASSPNEVLQRPLAKKSKRSISMVVVKTDDNLVETYTANDDLDFSTTGSDDIEFDNDSFWNGSLTFC